MGGEGKELEGKKGTDGRMMAGCEERGREESTFSPQEVSYHISLVHGHPRGRQQNWLCHNLIGHWIQELIRSL